MLVLSESECRVLGYVQGTSPIWSEDPAFHFPSGALPRGAVIGDLTGDGVTDIAVASSRYDGSGSSIAVYPGGAAFSNSNLTVWADDYANATLIATGDLDGDGSQDLVLVYPEQNAFGYMLGCSGDTNIVGIGFAAETLLVADVDADGMADVITANTTHGYARVHFGNETLPSGSWRPLELECHGNVTDIAIGDLDGDGLVDVAAATAEGTIEIFFNTGSDPAFSYPLAWNATMAGPILSLAVGDFDSDGLDDLAYTRPERHIEVMIQKTSGNPISPPVDFTLAATEGPLGQIWAGEVTGDYLVDIIAMKASGDKVFVFDQTSFEDMVESDTIILPESPVHVSVMDVTDDERADMAVIYPSADLLFLYGQSGQSLPDVPSMVFVSGALPACSGFGDVSGDGVPDLLTLDSRSGSVSAWRPVILDVGPTAMFALTDESPDEGAPFSFVDESVGYDPIVEWSWTLTRPDMTNETWDLDGESMAQVVFVEGDGDYIMRLDVFEPDGDTDSHVVGFTVAEVPPDVTMTLSPSGGRYMEFEPITFQALAETFDPVTLYEWQFDSSEAGFDPDVETEEGSVVHYYTSVGLYTAKVRVTDSNGSATIESVQLEVLDEELSGTFDDIVVTRDPDATYIVTFDASALALAHPEITGVTWEFGDGGVTTLTGPPAEPVTHTYSPVRDYIVNVSLSDDDGNTLRMSRTLSMIAPTVTLIGPDDGAVVASGTPIRLTVADDNPPVVSVQYSVNGGPFLDFESLYSISTEGWADGLYHVEVMVEDADGNIVRELVVSVTIDDTDPSVYIFWDVLMLYGGDRVNISARVVDVSGLVESVILEVYFPGDDSGSQILMRPAGGNVYYAHVEVPKREGTLQFCVYAEDAAGNTASSGTYSVQIELRFMDASWPYMLAFAVLAALLVAMYFLREVTIAVDETFVIYNDGRLLAHSTRRLKPGMDDQVLSGMFVAVQDFIKDSFKDETSFRLRKLDFGDKSVLVEKGRHLFLAVVLHGKASKKVARRMKAVLDDIEAAFAEHLADWDGDLDKVRGVNDRVKRLYSKAPALPRPSKGKGA